MKFRQISKEKKVKGSIATYKQSDGVLVCDEKELAISLMNYEGLPEKLSFIKASELAALARSYLALRDKYAQ